MFGEEKRVSQKLVNLHIEKGGTGGFPGGSVVKNPPSNAGDMGSNPGRGIRIPHATRQVSPWTTTTEAQEL